MEFASVPAMCLHVISDTGIGSCLDEFQDLKFLREAIGAEKWNGVLSVRTTMGLKYVSPSLKVLMFYWQRSIASFKREHLKFGSGIACCTEGQKNTGLLMEAVIVISEISEPTSSCFRPCGAKSEVLCFKDFTPCPIPQSSGKALTSIDWKSYGLTLGSIVNQCGYSLLEWEVMLPSTRQKTQLDRNLVKRVVKLALDDLKEKHAGVLLSAHALKIRSHAPDLAKTIAGLIFSSKDSGFQGECCSLLGLQSQGVGGEIVEDCIKEKIISVIEMNDRKSNQRSEEVAPFLFENDCLQMLEFQEEEYEEGDDGDFNPLDI
uniref:Type 2 DNA topoisomerase 6 subunit B-like n=1 Tax=Fagus sylvatica TaxID=28930 RepID=A0A2N9IPT0_FAGSY